MRVTQDRNSPIGPYKACGMYVTWGERGRIVVQPHLAPTHGKACYRENSEELTGSQAEMCHSWSRHLWLQSDWILNKGKGEFSISLDLHVPGSLLIHLPGLKILFNVWSEPFNIIMQ